MGRRLTRLSYISVNMDFLKAEILVLVRIHLIDLIRIVLKNVINILVQQDGNWEMPIIEKFVDMNL